MRNIKLVKAWGPYVKGNWAAVEDKTAENLIGQGIAIDPARPKPEPTTRGWPTTMPEPVQPKAAKKKAAKKKAKRKHPARRKLK
jgi:hypothetical protein